MPVLLVATHIDGIPQSELNATLTAVQQRYFRRAPAPADRPTALSLSTMVTTPDSVLAAFAHLQLSMHTLSTDGALLRSNGAANLQALRVAISARATSYRVAYVGRGGGEGLHTHPHSHSRTHTHICAYSADFEPFTAALKTLGRKSPPLVSVHNLSALLAPLTTAAHGEEQLRQQLAMAAAALDVVWFASPRLTEQHLVADPSWLAKLAEAVLIGRFVQPRLRNGVLPHSVLARIWKPLVDPRRHEYCCGVLRRFEMLYEWPAVTGTGAVWLERTSFMPALLPATVSACFCALCFFVAQITRTSNRTMPKCCCRSGARRPAAVCVWRARRATAARPTSARTPTAPVSTPRRRTRATGNCASCRCARSTAS